ncbi:MAG: hypothetical protein AMXMBFR47_42000 [Planctomycetota bacterium]
MRRPRILRQADLRKKIRPPRIKKRLCKPALHVSQVLEWADEHFKRTGHWPHKRSGEVHGVPFQTWYSIEKALAGGYRGLPKGLTIVQLLWKHRRVRSISRPPKLTLREILRWIDLHQSRTGRWPGLTSGPLHDAPWENWPGIDRALNLGTRGLRGGDSLARLLYRHRGVRNANRPPKLTIKTVLRWADAHHARTGCWPHSGSGPVRGAPGETWSGIATAFQSGTRGLNHGSLSELLHRRRGARRLRSPKRLDVRRIIEWADDHRARTGDWPHVKSGRIAAAPEESWAAVDASLRVGGRGLRPGSSLARVLEIRRGVANRANRPRLSESQILRWARAHLRRTGAPPRATSGTIVDAPGETWIAIDSALRAGSRGLPGGSSVARLLARRLMNRSPR